MAPQIFKSLRKVKKYLRENVPVVKRQDNDQLEPPIRAGASAALLVGVGGVFALLLGNYLSLGQVNDNLNRVSVVRNATLNDNCSENPCIYGTCINKPTGYLCDCEEKASGDRCEVCNEDYFCKCPGLPDTKGLTSELASRDSLPFLVKEAENLFSFDRYEIGNTNLEQLCQFSSASELNGCENFGLTSLPNGDIEITGTDECTIHFHQFTVTNGISPSTRAFCKIVTPSPDRACYGVFFNNPELVALGLKGCYLAMSGQTV